MKIINTLVLLCVGVMATSMGCAQSDGIVELPSTNVPLPLGRYIEMASTEIPYTITEPDRNGNCQLIADFDFRILRHVPKIMYVQLGTESSQRSDRLRFKIEHNQGAVTQLVNAIEDKTCDYVPLQLKETFSDCTKMEVQKWRREMNGAKVYFVSSEISLKIPKSRIHIGGQFSSDITPSDAGWISINADDNNRPYISFSSHIYFTRNAYNLGQISVRIWTTDGKFELTYPGENYHGTNKVAGTYSHISGNMYIPDMRITPKEMDDLLSSDIEVEIRIERYN